MKNKDFLLNTLLAAVVGLVLLAAMLWKTFFPAAVLPALDVPILTALALAALILDCYLAPGAKRSWPAVAILAAAAFGLLPWAAGFVTAAHAGKLALVGGVLFTALTWLFDQAAARMASGPSGKLAPVCTALIFFLSVQCFTGIFF